MRVGVVDVGSNTVRLLVAGRDSGRLEPVREEREYLFLGEDVERDGRLRAGRIETAARCAGRLARAARRSGAARVEVIVTAPGRQAENGGELLHALAAASAAPVRLLSVEEEGRLAFQGALAAARPGTLPASVAVCDVGGGSTEVVVGTREGGPAWACSLNLGAVRLTQRCLQGDPPGRRALAAAREEVEGELGAFAPPLPQAALAAGGTARALRKLVGPSLDEDDLAAALHLLGKRSSAKAAKLFGLHPRRARALPAGAVILAAVQHRLGVPLQVARAGLREGAAQALLDELAASAA
jgi:exopolyphosphatase/guanosine-5'-triphosphate,3'-diphosphate pyrophosphatase